MKRIIIVGAGTGLLHSQLLELVAKDPEIVLVYPNCEVDMERGG